MLKVDNASSNLECVLLLNGNLDVDCLMIEMDGEYFSKDPLYPEDFLSN